MNSVGLHAIAELCPDGIVFINEQGRVGYINRAFAEMSGFSVDQVLDLEENILARRILALCDDKQTGQCDISKIQSTEIMRWHSPTCKSISCTIRQLNNEQGKSLGRVLYFHDIASEVDRNRLAKSEFLSVAAHKLRTPLVGILGFSELLLKRDFDQSQQADVIATIHRQANDFKQLLDDFLDIERIDARKGMDFKIEKNTLETVFDDAATDASLEVETVEVSYQKPEHWPEVQCDINKIKQVFINLVSNAIKYSPAGSAVSCSTVTRTNNGVDEFGLKVVDQGVGMTPEEFGRIGERFYRVDDSQPISGSGLGISLVKEIMEIHHGSFDIESKKGKGTTATVWLPVA